MQNDIQDFPDGSLDDPLDDMVVLDWRDLAACADDIPDMFFPAGETGPAAEQIAYAKSVCAGCDVADECLDYSIETNQIAGIWGGLTEDERRPVRRQWLAERRRKSS